jgi:outer membrane putative beta-barrel porin/alpha-amylase
MMRRSLLGLVAFLAVSIAVPTRAAAQSTVTEIVEFLMTNRDVVTDDFARDRAAVEVARDAVTRALLVSLTSVPIATSSGGFVYRLNPELGTVERATESFGGFFVERALTPGHGRAAFGVSASTAAFDNLDNHDLRNGSFITIANRFRDEATPFDTESLTLRVRSSTMTAFASVGITSRFEIGAAVPFLQLTLEGERVNVYHGDSVQQAAATATANGIGDAAIRAKVMMLAARSGGVALAGELRLPTGDERNLLGAGTMAVRVMGIGSLERSGFSLHGNAGLVRGGVSDEYTFGGAAAVAVAPQVTLTGELAGRYLSELRSVVLTAAPHPSYEGVDTWRLTGGDPGRTIANAIAGFKWNPTGTFVVAAHLRWSLTSAGLTAPLTPSIGMEYAF